MSSEIDKINLVEFYGQFEEVHKAFEEVCGNNECYDMIDNDDLSDWVSEQAFRTGDEWYIGFVEKLIIDPAQAARIMREYLQHKMRLTGSITARTHGADPSPHDRETRDMHRTLTEAEMLEMQAGATRDVSMTSYIPRQAIPPEARPTSAQDAPAQTQPIDLQLSRRRSGPADPSASVSSAQTVILPAVSGQRGHVAAPAPERLSELPPVEQRMSEAPPASPSAPKVIIAGNSLITHKSRVSEGRIPRPVATPNGSQSLAPAPPLSTSSSSQKSVVSSPPPQPSVSPPVVISERDVETRAAQIVQSLHNTKNHAAQRETWRTFRESYFNLVYQLERFLATTSRIEHGPFLPENRRAILNLAHATDILASKVLEASVEIVTNPPASLEHALIASQRNMIGGIRNLIMRLSHSIAKFEDEKARSDIRGFLDNWRQVKNPMRWAFGFFTGTAKYDVVSTRRQRFDFSIPPNLPQIYHNKPHVLLDLIDLIFIRALKKKVSLNFELANITNEMAITNKKALKKLRSDKKIAALVEQLGGRWDLPGRFRRAWRSIFNRAAVGRPPYHRLLIPVKMQNGNGSVSNPPETNSQGKTPQSSTRQLGEAPTIAAPILNGNRYVERSMFSAWHVFSPVVMPPFFMQPTLPAIMPVLP
jgi:hypothetical protein